MSPSDASSDLRRRGVEVDEADQRALPREMLDDARRRCRTRRR